MCTIIEMFLLKTQMLRLVGGACTCGWRFISYALIARDRFYGGMNSKLPIICSWNAFLEDISCSVEEGIN